MDEALDTLRRFTRKTMKKTAQLIDDAKKAAGLPAGGPVTEANPRYYLVSSDQGALVREAVALDSPEIVGLKKGEMVVVVEKVGRRGRIIDPVEGWISISTNSGERILTQTYPPDKKTQILMMEKRFERLKEQKVVKKEFEIPQSDVLGNDDIFDSPRLSPIPSESVPKLPPPPPLN
jgi:SH3-like domain-containing protein